MLLIVHNCHKHLALKSLLYNQCCIMLNLEEVIIIINETFILLLMYNNC